MQFVTQRRTAPRISGTTSSTEMHKRPRSEEVRRYTWPERRAEGRGLKTCLQKIEDVESIGSLWFAARSFGVKLHGDDYAYRRVFGAVFTAMQTPSLPRITSESGQFLWATAMNLSQVSCRHSWRSSSRSLLAICLCTWHECHYSSRSSHM